MQSGSFYGGTSPIAPTTPAVGYVGGSIPQLYLRYPPEAT